jgi:hypothetical protein
MNQLTKRTVLRTAAVILHTLANFIILSYLLSFDIAGGWLSFSLFALACLLLLGLLAAHLVSFIRFLQLK